MVVPASHVFSDHVAVMSQTTVHIPPPRLLAAIQSQCMTDPIDYTEALDPLLSVELPSGWMRGLIQHPLQVISGDPTAIDRQFARDLAPELPAEPIATQLLFVYLHGYEPNTERPMRSERRVTVGYFPSMEQFVVH